LYKKQKYDIAGKSDIRYHTKGYHTKDITQKVISQKISDITQKVRSQLSV